MEQQQQQQHQLSIGLLFFEQFLRRLEDVRKLIADSLNILDVFDDCEAWAAERGEEAREPLYQAREILNNLDLFLQNNSSTE